MKQQTFLNQTGRKCFLLIALLLMGANSVVLAQITTFTYQGRLTDGGTAANGTYDLQFALFDSASSGGQIGSSQTVPSVPVSSGIFTVSLDFGAGAFSGANRFLEISARLTGGGTFTLLAPRQQITATPYAVRSLVTNAADALTGACVGCVQDANINAVAGSKVNGTIPVASVPAGSTSYVQNTSSPQASSNFNISGNGTAGGTLSGNIVSATTQYNIGGNRVLSLAGTANTFLGLGTGLVNTGSFNSFFGSSNGQANTTGLDNSFFGSAAGNRNTMGSDNSFFGDEAGVNTLTGSNNSFFGGASGRNNTTGDNNTIIGARAEVGSNNLTYATAIGAGAVVGTSNTIVLGRDDGSDFVRIPGFLTIPNLAAAGNTQLCRNAFDRIGACSSSLRYKTNLAAYRSGLSVINRLRPISFTWKEGGMRDLGFGAEDVEKIDPLLVTYNQQGQVEGVKYDRINVVLVNAIKEQQDQIERQQADVRQQQNQIEALRTANAALNARLRGIEKVLRQSAGPFRRRR